MKFWKKYVFLQALFLTVVMFLIGMYVGIVFEKSQLDTMESYYAKSEISLMDIIALNNLIDSRNISCDILKEASFDFADRIYKEALLLEQYEKSGKITDNMIDIHNKYDLLRTFLWMSVIKEKEKCGEFSSVIYLYNYEVNDLTIKAEQSVWSKILYELKQNNPDEVLLIPIARDSSFVSLDALTKDLNITSYPTVVINEKYVFYNLTSSAELENYIK